MCGSFTQSGSTGTFATLTDNGITYTAKRMGTYGNSITVALVTGGTAGSETVTVTGKNIVVAIESTVSTRTQVKNAIDGNAAAAALISVSVSSGGTAATLMAATALATGTNTAFTSVAKGFSIDQTGTGEFTFTLQDTYAALLAFNAMTYSASAADLTTQIKSIDVTSAKTIVLRVEAAATPTNLSSGQALYIDMKLRNSATPSS